MGSDSSNEHELGNMSTVKASEARVTDAGESNSERDAATDYGDKSQLARLGKKQVLKVRCVLHSPGPELRSWL